MNRTFSVAIMVASVVLTFQSSFAAELEPRKADTLWTRTTDQIPRVGQFIGCAMGGSPRVFIAGTMGGDLLAFDPLTGDTLRRVELKLGSIYNISFARNANIFSTTSPFTVKIWRWPEMNVIKEIKIPNDDGEYNRHVQAILTSDGKRIVIAAYDYDRDNGGVYDVESGTMIHRIPCGPMLEPVLTPDDRFLVSMHTSPQVHDMETGNWVANLPGGEGGAYRAFDITDNGRYVAVSRPPSDIAKGSVVIYDMVEQREVMHEALEGSSISDGSAFRFSDNEGSFFVGRVFGNAGWYDFHPRLSTEPTKRFKPEFFSLRFSPDRRYAFDAAGTDAFVSQLDATVLSSADQRDSHSLVRLKPNPSHDMIEISGLSLSDGLYDWELLDLQARSITKGQVAVVAGTTTINVPWLPSSTYLLRILSGDQILSTHQIQR